MIPFFCRAARRRSRITFVTAGKNHVKHEERLRTLVLGTKGLERRDPQQNARTFQSNGLERLSDIIIESCVTGKGVFLVCQKPLGEH